MVPRRAHADCARGEVSLVTVHTWLAVDGRFFLLSRVYRDVSNMHDNDIDAQTMATPCCRCARWQARWRRYATATATTWSAGRGCTYLPSDCESKQETSSLPL